VQPAEPVIEVRGLVKEFGSAAKVQALRDVQLTVSAGEFVAVMGASGSGKSTLLNLLAGLDEPTDGSIRIVGTDLATLGEDQRARMRRDRLGLVFQAFHLLGTLTAEENVLLPLSIQGTTGSRARKRAKAALERVGLLHRRRHLPEALSGGEKQRVAIARALVIEPVILLADEPTGNLDSDQGERIMDILRGLVDEQGQTLLLVTHDPGHAVRADRVLVLRDGRLVSDTAAEPGQESDESIAAWAEVELTEGRTQAALLVPHPPKPSRVLFVLPGCGEPVEDANRRRKAA
jgi:putative ABC transport system ATP-binding protein